MIWVIEARDGVVYHRVEMESHSTSAGLSRSNELWPPLLRDRGIGMKEKRGSHNRATSEGKYSSSVARGIAVERTGVGDAASADEA